MKEEKNLENLLEKNNIILFFSILIISFSFFYILNSKTGIGFGITEILFSIVISIFATSSLIWSKSIISKNRYLGVIVGLLLIGLFEYSLYNKYSGIYTNFFAITIFTICFIYLGKYFLNSKRIELNQKNK